MTTDHLDYIKRVNPKLNPKYSRRIYSFLLRHKHIPAKFSAFTDPDGVTFLGIRFDDDNGIVTGARLHTVMTGRFGLGFYLGSQSWVEVENFWSEYERLGVCALDPKHNWSLSGERFETVSKTVRCCRWCGVKQKLKSRVVREKLTFWEPVSQPSL